MIVDRSISTTSPEPAPSRLWSLVLDRPQVDADELAVAIEEQVNQESSPDFRTRLLLRDSLEALERFWGRERFSQWLARSDKRGVIEMILEENLGERGFPSLRERVMETTKKETVMQFLRELGSRVNPPAAIAIGGSIALMLRTDLSRRTEDIDVVDEVPASIRNEHNCSRIWLGATICTSRISSRIIFPKAGNHG